MIPVTKGATETSRQRLIAEVDPVVLEVPVVVPVVGSQYVAPTLCGFGPPYLDVTKGMEAVSAKRSVIP
jgi:hypothetical protein